MSSFKRPNSEKILAAPAQSTGGLKGIIAGGITGGIESESYSA